MFHMRRFLAALVLVAAPVFGLPNFFARNGDFSDPKALDGWIKNTDFSDPKAQDGWIKNTDECKKDILIILDTSRSITKTGFEKVQPFLVDLAKDLNLRPTGTQAAVMLFSDNVDLKLKFSKDNKQTFEDFSSFIKGLDYTAVSGGQTKTGLALQKAYDEVFTENNPENVRKTISDMILLVTDGAPIGSWYKNKFDNNKWVNEEDYAKIYAKKFREEKKIRMIGLAMGPGRNSFKKKIEEMTDATYDADFENLKTIITDLVDASCIEECECPKRMTPITLLLIRGSTMSVDWSKYLPKSNSKCKVTAPARSVFGAGQHEETYSYGNKKCPVSIQINRPACECPSELSQGILAYVKPGQMKAKVSFKSRIPVNNECPVSNAVPKEVFLGVGDHTLAYGYGHQQCKLKVTVKRCGCTGQESKVAYIKPGEKDVSVSWSVPTITCPGKLKSSTANPGHSFPGGKHTVYYVYATTAGFDVQCSVNIQVKECSCPAPIKHLAYVTPDNPGCKASWNKPTPRCGGETLQISSVSPSVAPGKHEFAIGQHTVTYTFSTANGVTFPCDALIEVKVLPCAGQDYSPSEMVCCQGYLHEIKSGSMCCGGKYYDPTKEKCCFSKYGIIAPKRGACPKVC